MLAIDTGTMNPFELTGLCISFLPPNVRGIESPIADCDRNYADINVIDFPPKILLVRFIRLLVDSLYKSAYNP